MVLTEERDGIQALAAALPAPQARVWAALAWCKALQVSQEVCRVSEQTAPVSQWALVVSVRARTLPAQELAVLVLGPALSAQELVV